MKIWACLPDEVGQRLHNVADVREIRIRNGKPIRINVGGSWYVLGEKGLTNGRGGIVSGYACDEIVRRACNNSVYAYEKMLARGFFTLEDGVRVGVCGELAGASEPVFRSYSSLCFRIPHYVSTADKRILDCCSSGNVVVIGPPCSGKTTMLRDIAVKLSQKYNVLAVDERGELFYDEVAECVDCDVLKWSSKDYAFETGVRAMSPQWIVCDEIAAEDVAALRKAANSGVSVACSSHGRSVEDFYGKFDLKGVFANAVVLERVGRPYRIVPLCGSTIAKNG